VTTIAGPAPRPQDLVGAGVDTVWAPDEADQAPRTSPRQLAWRRFRRNRVAMVAVGLLVVLALIAIFAPIVAPYDPLVPVTPAAYGKPPSLEHLFGTDNSGRDELSRIIFGSRVSLSVGIVAVSIYLTIGILLGAISGYRRGLVDATIMRITDTVMSFPPLIIILAIIPILGPSIFNIMLVIGLLNWPAVARLVRGEFLSLREREFTLAARGIGASDARIIFRHILPNVAGPLVVVASFGVADAIITEAGLSLLGLGVQPPDASWGNMLSAATDVGTLALKPWLWIAPGMMIAAAVLSINFIGDGLRDALDPRGSLRR
jgi:peptide/nickel transport system permease protein